MVWVFSSISKAAEPDISTSTESVASSAVGMELTSFRPSIPPASSVITYSSESDESESESDSDSEVSVSSDVSDSSEDSISSVVSVSSESVSSPESSDSAVSDSVSVELSATVASSVVSSVAVAGRDRQEHSRHRDRNKERNLCVFIATPYKLCYNCCQHAGEAG